MTLPSPLRTDKSRGRNFGFERFAYWTMFALMVLSIEKLSRNLNWNIFNVGARGEKAITAITFLGIALLLVWAVFHL